MQDWSLKWSSCLVSFLFIPTNLEPNTMCKNYGQSGNMNCMHGCLGTAIITKNVAVMKFLSQKFTYSYD